jgi:Glycosyl hydrolase family 26
MRARCPLLVMATVCTVFLTACSSGKPPTPATGIGASRPAGQTSPIIGVYEPDDPGSYPQVSAFARAIGRWPAIVSYYGHWGMPFQRAFASQVFSHGGETLVQIDPRYVTLAAIASGQHDRYLRAYASAVRSFGHQVIISFGQEMNGNWYSWGAGHTAPAVFIAAWRHIINLFRAEGVRNITWLWDVNCAYPNSSPISEWWPGSSYVNWVGLDCYYGHRNDTFNSLFPPNIAAIRQITDDPILIAETAIAPIAGTSKVEGLFNGVRENHLLGFVWFDQAQHDGISPQNWRLEDNPGMLAAFRKAVARFAN